MKSKFVLRCLLVNKAMELAYVSILNRDAFAYTHVII